MSNDNVDPRDNEEHIPSPFAWTDEERRKYAVMAEACPMCQYKFQFATIQQLHNFVATLEEESPQWQTMMEGIADKTQNLMALGLVIANEQCSRNSRTFEAMFN